MPRPPELLRVARSLVEPSGAEDPTDAALRRTVSTAYYALFHTVLRAAAAHFMGAGREDTAGFALLYRGFDHRRMRVAAEEIAKETPKREYRESLRGRLLSQDMRDFATEFGTLQAFRHLADYDPSVVFNHLDASALVDAAGAAIAAFHRTTEGEQADVLALMLVGTRA